MGSASEQHEINGDERLSPADRIKYIARNFLRNLGVGQSGLMLRNWTLPAQFRSREYLGMHSATRALSEAFILHTLPTLLKGREISVLDIGCGTGRMSGLLKQAGLKGKYTGVDISNRFKADDYCAGAFDTEFLEGDIHEIEWREKYDLILSVSALEHIPRDEEMLAKLDGILNPGGIQLHFVPSATGLFLYLWHGLRQYGLNAIRMRFGTKGVTVFRLGGIASSLLHILYVTIPDILLGIQLRRKATGLYNCLLKAALAIDSVLPVFPGFYAIYKVKQETEQAAVTSHQSAQG